MVARTLPGLGLTGFWDLGENGWKPGMDTNLQKLSAIVNGSVKSRTTALPGSPTVGDIYIVPSTDPTNPNKVAIWDGASGSEAWVYLTPKTGWAFYVIDEAKNYQFGGSVWVEFAGAGGGGGLSDAPADGNLYGRKDASWEIVPGTAPAKFFARLSKTAATTVPASTTTIISWDNEVLDNGGFYDAGAPTRLTIPAGVTEVVVSALIRSESAIGGGTADFAIEIRKNGLAFIYYTIDNQFWGPPPISTGVIPVVEGDYFEIAVWCNASLPLHEPACYFSIHGIGTSTVITSATILQNTTAPDEYIVTGPGGNGYATIEAARDQMVTDGENAGFYSPAKIKILTRSLSIGSTITLPQHCSIVAENTRIRFTGASGSVFNLGGYNRIKGLEFCGGNAANTDAVFNCGDNTDMSILECHLYGNDTDNFMKFMKAEGAAFARLNAERCLINYRGKSGYAFRFNNTGSGSRFCDVWFENIFSDTYSALTGAGGNFESINCKDMRLKRSTIRGNATKYTGLRLSGASCSWHLAQCNFDAAPGGAQPGFDIYAVAGSRLDYGAVSAKRTGFETGSTIVALSTDLIALDAV